MALALLAASSLPAAMIVIEPADIHNLPSNIVGSGNGTLDLITHSFAGGQIKNTAGGGFNGDNGVSDLPQGGGADVNSFAESYLTSFGDLQQFYLLNFNPPPNELILYLDLNETGAVAQATNWIRRVEIWLNPTVPTPGGSGNLNPVNNDIDSNAMSGINTNFSGGTLLSSLSQPVNAPVSNQGAGAADFVIFTGVDPFAYAATDTILIFLEMDTLNNGSETIFLSGDYSGDDLREALGLPPAPSPLPEPSTVLMLGIGLLALIRVRRRRATRN